MPKFVYKVRDKQGQERQETQEAATQEQLVARLQKEGLLITSVARQDLTQPPAGGKVKLRHYHVGVTSDDLVVFGRQLATLLGAGVTLLKSLEVLNKQVESWRLHLAIREITYNIAAGSSFGDALAKRPDIFSKFWVHIVETGEASGALPLVLGQLAGYLETSAAIRRKVISALIYPAVLVCLCLAALTVFTVWIIPIFSRVFTSFNVELPLLTQAIMALSNFLRRYILVLFAGLAALIYAGRKYIRTETGKWQLDRLKFKIPVLSSLFQRVAIERFASGLATLIESGVPIVYGLDIIGPAVGNKVVEKAIGEVKESVRQGKTMSGPMEASGVFTPMAVQIVSVGEEIGELGKMLRKISEFYQERIATTLTRLTTLIEPAVLIFMGVVVGVLVVSMFLPIFQLAMVR